MTNIPNYSIAYKDQSALMKILAKLMFFNPTFMTDYVTTIGSTIYFPSQAYVKRHPISTKLVICHELIHIKDSGKFTMPIFWMLYAFPQIFSFLSIPLFFIHWWAGLLCLLFLAPLPAFFRMYFELKAYTFSIYSIYRLNQMSDYKIKYDQSISFYANQFSGSDYYYMWPCSGAKAHLSNALDQFQQGKKPFYSIEYYDMVDALLSSSVKLS